MRIAVGRLDLNNGLTTRFGNLKNRNIERTTTQVVDSDFLIFVCIKSVRQRCRSRLVDDAFHIKTGNATRVFRRLALSIVKVGRNRDDSLFDFGANVVLSNLFQFRENGSADLFRRNDFTCDFKSAVRWSLLRDIVGNKLDLFLNLFKATADKALRR